MTKAKPKLQNPTPETSYDVGYAKPPSETRFTPGRSGNPRGRPKGAKNKLPKLNEERLKSIVLEEAYRDITLRDGARNVTIPMAQAVMRSLAVNAAKGQHRAQRLFAEMLSTTERQHKALADEWLTTAMDYKIEWDRELDRRARLGITDLPEPLPHPDHVKIDMNTGEARVEGPWTKEEKAELDMLLEKRAYWEEELVALRDDLEREEDEAIKEIIRGDIEHTEKIVKMISHFTGRLVG